MNQTIQVQVGTELITEECCACGVLFAMPVALRNQLLATGKCFYCPSGHSQHFIESTETKLRRANERLREEKAYASSLLVQRDGALR